MPIKELIAAGLISVGIIAATGGPWNLRGNLLKAQLQILKEVGRTDNWGDPRYWAHQKPANHHKHRTKKL